MKFIRKSVSVILSLILIISLFTILSPEAFAAAEVQYIERSWDSANQKVVDTVKTCTDYTTITSQSSLTIGSGKWYVVNGDATIDKRVTVSGTAHIILLSGTLKCMYGIRLSKGNSLFVYPGKNSEGKLNPRTGDDEEANLGGNKGEDCGEFVFYGGTLDVFNNDWCSGATAIGGGGYGGNCGKLSFYGGTVDASNNGAAPGRKSYGAVIGDGSDAYSNDSDCYINIYGGTIKADNHADSNGSGIGGGEDSTGCPINILGGKITARAYNGAGIGSGQDGGSSTVTIKNAEIKAESNYGAGIGSGEDSDSESIIIENSYVEAASKTNSDSQVGAEGAGIGGGNCGKSESIKISKSVIIASSGRYGAGIGGGDESDGGNIEITDSNVFAHSAQGGAGIGGGDEKGCDSITLKDSFVVAVTDSDVNESGEKFLKDFGDYYNTIMYSISNPAVTEQAGFYAAGSLTAMAITYLIQGTHTGAGIGSGDSGTADNILIDNCIVMAQAGECAAGIGGGDEGGFGTISINNSNVHAEGGNYGAGIGTGDEAEKCGTINITNSTVTAKAGTDAAGIGTGNEVDQTPTININSSTVNSRGGAYGSGIGGGDATGGGSISIRNSTVNSYGGKDAAGIGGGEGGSGGTIKIYDSNVYAEGKSCGAGIGNGEDGYSTTVRIYGDSRVEAYGGNSDTSAIGHGDNGIFYGYSINTYIDDELKVKAGSSKDSTSVYYNKTRYDAIRDHKYALVYDCEHEHTEWWGQDSGSHVLHCSDCGKWLTSRERHTWNSDDICTVCGGKRIHLTLTIKEKNRSGQTVQKEKYMDGYTAYTLPECENVPDGYEFLYWKVNDPGSIDYFYPPGERLTATWASPVVEAVYLPLKETKYIDKNGVEKTVMAKQVSALEDMEYLLLVTDGWYVIDRDLDIKGTTRCYGDVKFIVEDGCTWSAERYEQSMWHRDFITSYGRGHSTFSLYGQKNQTGYIDGGYVRGASFSSYNQYGAKFRCYTAIFSESYEIFRGSFDSSDITGTDYGALLIDGGKNYFAMLSGGSQGSQIGWTELTDSISFSRISCDTPIKIKEGQAFKDNYGNIYKGEITLEQQAALSVGYNDKTLTPYLEHHYGEPQWKWTNDYKDATALFKCIDDGCDDEQLVNAKVTYEDKDDIRTSTATCELNGQTYTTTHSGRLHWKVNVKNTVHGTVTADESMVKKDEVVKLNITPDEGYVLKSWSVTPDDDSQSVETKSTQFVMPECDVTVSAEFIPTVPEKKPYIDENGEYHLGNVEYVEIDGEPYSVNDDGTIGEMLDTVELSYFDFALINNDSEYQINYYTGPTDISELVIPKTFNDKPVTVIGADNNNAFIDYGNNAKTQFDLVLNENIREIKSYTFYTMWVKKVIGDTSGLKKIGAYAFSWANSPDGFKLDIKLDYKGIINVGSEIFNHMNVTARIKHDTKFTSTKFGDQNVNYIFTDDHIYGEPEWKWSSDNSSAQAIFTCSDSRCEHKQTVDAAVTESDELTKTVYTATVQLDGRTYTDTKESEKQCSDIIIADANHGEMKADKASAYKGEKITLTPNPDDGYKLVSVNVKDTKGNDIEVSENSFIMPCSNVTVTAEFGKKQYAISYADDYDGGFISGPLYADEGDKITVNAVSYSGYELASLSYRDGSGSYIKINNNTFTMPASEVKVYASFRKANYNISYKTDGNGTITGASTAQFNDRVPITVTPNEGYVLNNLYAEDDDWRDPADIIDGCIVMYDGDITVRAEFIPITSAKEPYIDSNGEYHLGNIEYVQLGDDYYTVENGAVGSRIDSVELSYFDFTDNGSTYQINYYTGPTDNLTELVIPKTFNGKPITVLGTDNQNAFIANSNPKPQFTLTLNENIQVIKGYAFYTMWVKKVQGDTSALRNIGAYAFSWANSPDGYKLDIKLDYEGVIGVGKGIFNNMTVTARLKHATAFSSSSFMQKSITYVITDDAHSYGNPVWTWADDYSSASAKFTCADPRCKHEETADAEIISEYENGAPKYIAAASFEGKEYTNVKALENPLDASYSPEITAATALGNDGNLFSLSDSLVYTKAKLLGVQKKETIKTDTAGSGLRFVAELSSEFVGKDNIDYGFEVVKTSKNNTAGFAGATPTGGFDIMQNLINENSENIKSISCKNTSNNITGDARYGDRSADTAYKYVTLAVNDIPDTQGVAVRFYVEIDGAKYYSAYTNSNGEAFRGCCASYETLENVVR